jgi:hypothetical protein
VKEVIKKKIAGKIDESKYGRTRAGALVSTVLDDDKLDAMTSRGLTAMTTDMRSRRHSFRATVVSFTIVLISWLLLLLLPQFIHYLVIAVSLITSKGGLILLLVPLVSMLFGVYSLFRLWFPDLENEEHEAGLMQSYQYQSDSHKAYKVWVVSSIAATLNTLGSAITYIYIMDEWQQFLR